MLSDLSVLLQSLRVEIMVISVLLVFWATARPSARQKRRAASGKGARQHVLGGPLRWFVAPGKQAYRTWTGTAPSDDLRAPTQEQLLDAHWVADTVGRLERKHDAWAALEVFGRARSAGLKLAKLGEAEGQQLYFSLVTGAVRLGRMSEVYKLIRECRTRGFGLSLGLVSAATKLATSHHFYAECVRMYDVIAEDLDLVITDRCVWSCLIFCAVEARELGRCEFFFDSLKACGEVNQKDYGNMVRCAFARGDWRLALGIVNEMLAAELHIDLQLFNSVLASCVGADQMEHATNLFEVMRRSHNNADVVSYNIMVKGCAVAKRLEECFQLLEEMRSKGIAPSQVTYGILIDCCINQDALERGLEVFALMQQEGCKPNTVLYTTMIKGFSRKGSTDDALKLFGEMLADSSGTITPDIITYSTLIKALCDAGRMREALGLLGSMTEVGMEPDEVIYNNLIYGCIAEPHVRLAQDLFKRMVSAKVRPSTATFSIFARVLCAGKLYDEAFEMVQTEVPKHDVRAGNRLYIQLVHACLRDRRGPQATEVFKAVPHTLTVTQTSSLLQTCFKLNMWETATELVVLAADRGASIDKQDAIQLREAALRRRKQVCADAVTAAMAHLGVSIA